FEYHDAGVRLVAGGSKDYHHVSRRNAVSGFQDQPRFERDVVDERAVLAAQVLHRPVLALRFEGEVLARKTGIFRKAKLGDARPADCESLAGKRNGLRLTIRALNKKFAGHVLLFTYYK